MNERPTFLIGPSGVGTLEGESHSPSASTRNRRPGARYYHGPRRGRLRIDGVGVFSVGGPFCQIHFVAVATRQTHPSHPGPELLGPVAVWAAETARDFGPAAQSLCPGRACPRASVPGRHSPGPGASESQDSVGRRPVCRLRHPQRPARRRGCPIRAGPAGRPEPRTVVVQVINPRNTYHRHASDPRSFEFKLQEHPKILFPT